SVVHSSTGGWNGVTGGGTGGTVRNVTVIMTGATTAALSTFPGHMVVNVENSILRGAQYDINAGGNPGDNTVVNVSYSDYVRPHQSGVGAAVVAPGAGNITGAPLFANAPAGDFHELAGSPTIDAGFPVAGLGANDFDGGPRVVNSGSTCTALPD